MCACVAGAAVSVFISILMRSSLDSVVPFEALFIGFLSLILGDVLYGMIKFIPVKDKRTGQTKRWAIGMIFSSSIFHHTRTTHSHI